MEKTITIDGKDVKLNNNGAWALEYQDQFGKDILPVLLPLIGAISEALAAVLAETDGKITTRGIAEAVQGRTMEILAPIYTAEVVDLVYNVTWALAKNADPEIPEPKRWIRQFNNFPLDVIVPEVYGLIMQGFTSSKNWGRLEELKAEIKKGLQPLQQTKLSSPH